MTKTEVPTEAAATTTRQRVRRLLPQTYRGRLVLPMLVGLGVRLFFATFDRVPTIDEANYLTIGENIWDGDGLTRHGRPELHFPPFLPFILGGLGRLTGDPHAGTVLVTALAGALLLVVLAAIARRAAGDGAGIAAAWIAALAPGITIMLVTRGGGSEALYVLLVFGSAALAIGCGTGGRTARVVRAAAAGALLGLAYLTRPEGVLLASVILPVVALTAFGGVTAVRRRTSAQRDVRGAGLAAAGFMAALFLFVAPYAAFLHTHTGSWQLTGKSKDSSLAAWQALAEGDRRGRHRELYRLEPDGRTVAEERSKSLTALIREDPSGYLKIVRANARALREVALETTSARMPTWRLLPLPLLGLAAWGLWRRRGQAATWVVAGIGGLALLTALGFFVQPRYLAPATAATCVLTGVGIGVLPKRWWPWAVGGAVVLLGSSLLGAFDTPEGFRAPEERIEAKVVGRWLADRTDGDAVLLTSNSVLAYYADGRSISPPYANSDDILAFARDRGVTHVIADPVTIFFRPQLGYLKDAGPWSGLRLLREFVTEGRVTRVFTLEPAPG